MDGVLTLADRQTRRLTEMAAAIAALDVALAAYAASHGGRFIRFGSSATGALRTRSDIDLIADFADTAAVHAACRAADALCLDHGLVPDVRPLAWVSAAVLARALAEGVVLR